MANAKISMKLLVDKPTRKVLFAEAGKECVDFLLHILSLPLGTVVGLLTTSSMVGSIGSLYGSLEKLSADYLQDGLTKEGLLSPKLAAGSASNVPLLAIDQAPDDPAASKAFYICNSSNKNGHYYNNVHEYVSDAAGARCPYCSNQMNKKLTLVAPPAAEANAGSSGGGGYVKGPVTFMVMDDLSVEPMSAIFGIALLNKFNVQDLGRLEEKLVTLDMNLGLALLKASLVSKTVLTDVFLGNKAT